MKVRVTLMTENDEHVDEEYSDEEIQKTEDLPYYDNTPTVIMNGPTILHTRGLTGYRATNKLLDKLEAYYTERKGERND